MKRILIAALAAATLTSGIAISAGASAQGLQPSGTRAGGPGQAGSPGEIGAEQRTYLRRYVTGQGYAPVPMGERVVPGYTVPGGIELRTFPETVYGDVPSARRYGYVYTGSNVVLVDPATRQVIEVIE